MSPAKIKVVIMMLFSTAAVSVGEAMLSKGMRQTNAIVGGLWEQIRGTITNFQVVVGVALMTLYFILYALSLKQADFSFVLPLTALSYLLGAILAKYYLGETVTMTRWLGTLVITLGVAIVGFGEKH
ncbi:MAG: EamA family transporter [Chthonomonadaceae bacterium]|nr:EamA family transporter [Chthonomonadaceae bacterium]